MFISSALGLTNICDLRNGTQELQDRVAKAKDYSDEMMKIRKEIVDFHGEMVLLENYSALNYTGTEPNNKSQICLHQ